MSGNVSRPPRHLLGSLHSHAWLFGFSLLAVFIAPLRRSPSVLRPTSKTGCQVPTMVLSEARGLSLFRVIREGLESAVRLGARGTQRLTYQWRLALEPERLRSRTNHRPVEFQGMGRTAERHSSCLWFQMLGVERNSFLPNDQSDRRNFACQGQPCHLRPNALGHQSRVKFLERAGLGGSDDGCALENVFQFVIVIAIEPAQRDRPLRRAQLPIDVAMISAAVCLDSQTAVSPQLPLGAKAIRRLQDRDQLRRADRANRGNLAQQFRCLVLGALGEQLAPHLLTQRPQLIESLVVELR